MHTNTHMSSLDCSRRPIYAQDSDLYLDKVCIWLVIEHNITIDSLNTLTQPQSCWSHPLQPQFPGTLPSCAPWSPKAWTSCLPYACPRQNRASTSMLLGAVGHAMWCPGYVLVACSTHSPSCSSESGLPLNAGAALWAAAETPSIGQPASCSPI
jgi:hypothetical protein